MANSYYKVYIQAVFVVKYRNSVLNVKWRRQLFGVIGNLINETGCKTLIVNGVEDHVHCFLSLKPTQSISELMKTVKAKSSKYINDNKLTPDRFEWQKGYGVFSYNQSQVRNVFNYIKNQEEHHNSTSFNNEYIKLLNEFKIDYQDEFLFEALK